MSRTVLTNAHFLSANGSFRYGAIVIDGERITHVTNGGRVVPAELVHGADTVDLAGRFVVPGFVDTHFHLTSLALKSTRCDLAATSCAADIVAALKAWPADEAPYIMGVEWDESKWHDRTYPTRAMLDAVSDTVPVIARRICGHVAVVNTMLLERLGKHPSQLIDADSGLVREHAVWEASMYCEPDPQRLAHGFSSAIAQLHAMGITGIHDIVSPDRCDAYIEGVRGADRPLRIDALLNTSPQDFPGLRRRLEALDSRHVRAVGIKCFLDGSIGGSTAALERPYAGETGNGTLLIDGDDLRSLARRCFDNGWVCAMHAIGDRAIDQALDVITAFSTDTQLFRIEHFEMAGPRQLQKLSDAPVVLSMQPNFIREWGMPGGMYERKLGTHRYIMMNPLKSIVETGAELVFGSDGMPPGPLYGMKGATEHHVTGERLTPRQALDRYTRRPNTIHAFERNAGIIEPGRLADLVVLSGNPLRDDLDRVRVERTLLGGETVFATPGLR